MPCRRDYVPLYALTILYMATTAVCAVVHSKVCSQGSADEIRFNITVDEFSDAYRKTLSMQDGSTVDPMDNQHMELAFGYMISLMSALGVTAQKILAADGVELYSLVLCREDTPRVMLQAVLGNLMPHPGEDRDWGGVSSAPALPVVVVDHEGRLVVQTPFSTMRSIYLEVLVLISVLVIIRLTALGKPKS